MCRFARGQLRSVSECIRLIDRRAARVILICSFAVWRCPIHLHCLLPKYQVDIGDLLEICRSSSGGNKRIYPWCEKKIGWMTWEIHVQCHQCINKVQQSKTSRRFLYKNFFFNAYRWHCSSQIIPGTTYLQLANGVQGLKFEIFKGKGPNSWHSPQNGHGDFHCTYIVIQMP